MPTTRRIRIQPAEDSVLDEGIATIQRELRLPLQFPPPVEAAAAQAAANPRLPELDRSDIPLVTIDPPESMDLDQAMFLERNANGFRVYYAIADVAAFVAAGDAVDIEANRRGETLYAADSRIPLHPPVLSEGAASLLPGQLRPALLWTIDLDASGNRTGVDVRRARVSSRTKLNYADVQRSIDAGNADSMWGLLREIGQLLEQQEKTRGGISLALPEQTICRDNGNYRLEYRASLPVENWNAQISLLTGMAAAQLMVQGKVGLLRTLPAPPSDAIVRLRLTAKALHIAWPDAQRYPDFIRMLDPTQPRHVAMMMACTSVLRGADYAAFNGSLPAQPRQSAVAAEYAHATAPLRRLGDRYVGEVCVALCARQPVPSWALAALPGLPAALAASNRRAHQYERAVIDLMEAFVMVSRVGETFEATIVELDRASARNGIVMLQEPAIQAPFAAASDLTLGADVKVRLTQADPATRSLRFELAG